MSFGPIQFGGLASGLDTGAIIQALLQIEAQPIAVLESQKKTEESKLSLLGTLEGHVEALQEKAKALSEKGSFLAYTVAAADEGVASFTLTGDAAIPGSHTLQVNSLAAADRWAFGAVGDSDTTDLGGGTITFDYDGTAYSVDVGTGAGESTLDAIAAAINGQAGDAVTASVINVGTDSSPSYQLVVAGDDTGADFAIQNLDVGAVGLTAPSNVVVASNAEVLVDGLTVQRSSNVFDGVVEGVTFTVQQETAGPTTFTIDPDTEGVKTNVQEFLDAYNAVIDFLEQQSSYDSEEGAGGDLFGDPVLTTVRTTLQTALFDVDLAKVQADTEGYSTLGLVGIDVDADGRLVLDEAEFDEKLAADMDAMADLFTNETDGLLPALDDAIDDMVKSTTGPTGTIVPGLFDRREDTFQTLIDDLDDRIEDLESRLESVEATLVAKFSALEELMAGLNAQSAFLAGQLPSA